MNVFAACIWALKKRHLSDDLKTGTEEMNLRK